MDSAVDSPVQGTVRCSTVRNTAQCTKQYRLRANSCLELLRGMRRLEGSGSTCLELLRGTRGIEDWGPTRITREVDSTVHSAVQMCNTVQWAVHYRLRANSCPELMRGTR